MRTALTIAGSDSGGGAGIQADLKSFSANGVYGMSVITAITAQNTVGVEGVEDVSPKMVSQQLDAVLTDLPVDAVKIGMVSRTETIQIIKEKLEYYQPRWIVVDPVMISKSGHHLLHPDAKEALIQALIPLASVVTPNIKEAENLADASIESEEDMEKAARDIYDLGSKSVLVKGGHLTGDPTDILFDGDSVHKFPGDRMQTKNTHGTGCTLSSAIAAYLAQGDELTTAVEKGKQYIEGAIAHALDLGEGHGPTHHFYQWYTEEEKN